MVLKALFLCFIIFFILSVLSKPSAICFPLVLFLFDHLLKSKLDFKSLIVNKIPFIIVAVILGIATIYIHDRDKFINQNHAYAIHERIGYARYAILQYIYKFLFQWIYR